MAYRVDHGSLGKVERTPQGGIRCEAGLTRTGVFLYVDEAGRQIREYRPAEEVFNADSLATLRDAPVTDRHPPEAVTADNIEVYGVGHLSGAARQDGQQVAATIVVQRRATVQAVERKDRTQISCGYACKIDPTSGITPEGERFDCIQRAIVYNHVAIVERGRAGADVALRLDSAGNQITEDSSMSEAEIKALKDKLAAETARADAATARADVATAERDVAVARADAAASPQAIQAAVTARASVLAKAAAVLGKDYVPGNKSNAEIRKDVAAKGFTHIKLDSQSEAYITALYDAVAVPAVGETPRADDLAGALPTPPVTPPGTRTDAVDPKTAGRAALRELGTKPLAMSKS